MDFNNEFFKRYPFLTVYSEIYGTEILDELERKCAEAMQKGKQTEMDGATKCGFDTVSRLKK